VVEGAAVPLGVIVTGTKRGIAIFQVLLIFALHCAIVIGAISGKHLTENIREFPIR
jgi:hypothetical protein